LFARVEDFRREHLDEELYVKRNLGKIRYVRTTVYVLPKDVIPTAFAATRMMAEPASQAYSKFLGITVKQYEEASESIMEILKGKKGMTTKLIKRALGTPLNISPIVNLMCDQGLLVRGEPAKGWKSNIHTYYLFSEYFPDIKSRETSEEDAREAVVRQYLASFGPVTENDVSWWTGFPIGQIKQILEELRGEITYIDVSDSNKTFLALSRDEISLKYTKIAEKYVVNILPSLDPYMMGFKDRERYLNQEHYDFIFNRSGNATSTILIDGRVVGIWDFSESKEPMVKLFLFKKAKKEVLGETHLNARRVGRFIADKEVKIRECDSMVPLTQRTAGGVMSPLRGC
jgi:hypothetical protein